MHISFIKLNFLLFLLITLNGFSQIKKDKVLVFTRTCGYIHESIPAGVNVISELGKGNNFTVESTDDDRVFLSDTLFDYDAIVFLSTTLDILNVEQQKNLVKFIKMGKGFVGIHAAADTEYDWPWYGKLVGGYFVSHPEGQLKASIHTLNKNSFFTNHLDDKWEIEDEWYNYQYTNPNINPLLNLDENTYEGGTNGKNHPITWYHEFDGGRSFYTGLGHPVKTYEDERFKELLKKGILYATGQIKL